jgi:hypothetical protein
MADEELSQDEVDDSLKEQGFAPEYGSDRWVSDLESQFATDEDEPVEAEEVAEEVAVGGGDSQAADGDTPAPDGDAPDYVQLGDVRVPQDEAERVARFWDWMNTNPDEAMQFVGYMSGEYDLVPKGQQPVEQQPQQPSTPVDESDPYEDWDLLPETVQERLKKVDKLESYLAAQHKQQQSVVQQQNLKSVETAQAQFANTYDLNSSEVSRLADEAARLNIVPALVQETGDPVRAVERALEIVYLQSEQGREREFNKRIAQTEAEKDKQRKMAAVGGTAGSVPRQEPDAVPGNAAERRSAMVNEIAAALGKVT